MDESVDAPTYDELRDALQEELVNLWSDFDLAKQYALVPRLDPANPSGGWSMAMTGIADRIGAISKLVGSPSWEKIQVPLLLDGWWRAVHDYNGLPTPAFDTHRAREMLERIHAFR